MIKVEKLSKSYTVRERKVPVLKEVSIQAEDGEVIGIIGKSGGGKSTLLKVIRGMESFESGKIAIDDLVVTPESSNETLFEQNRITAIHLQREFGLWTESALRNVVRRINSRRIGFEVLPTEEDAAFEEIHKEAMSYLKLVGLDKKANHLATILSGGEKQRLMIARQLAKKPKVLLLDEPATMACPTTKQEVLETILKVNSELGLTTIVVSHLPEIHRYIADRLIWMESGTVVDSGEPNDILERFMRGLAKADPLPPRPVADPLIKIEHLYKRNWLFGTGEVLKMADLNFKVNRGETIAIIGASGAGKTTLLSMMEGYRKPDDGVVLYKVDGNWVNLMEYTPQRMEARRNLGIMYQEYALMPGERILDQIAYKLGVKGATVLQEAREKAKGLGISDQALDMIYSLTDMTEEDSKAALDNLNLTRDIFAELFPRPPGTEARRYAEPVFKMMDLDLSILDKLPEELSGGESVRATLAILLAANPKILILDEPFGDIDPITLRDVANTIKRIQTRFGTTIILVSHHIDLVREVSHRALLMEGGAVVMDGDADTICDAFISRCGADYLKKS
jgi:methyl coenzyme M reductase system subunit A2